MVSFHTYHVAVKDILKRFSCLLTSNQVYILKIKPSLRVSYFLFSSLFQLAQLSERIVCHILITLCILSVYRVNLAQDSTRSEASGRI